MKRENIKALVLIIGAIAVISIIMTFLFPKSGLREHITGGVTLLVSVILVFVTYYLADVNEKLVGKQQTPTITAQVDLHPDTRKVINFRDGDRIVEQDIINEELFNEIRLLLVNCTANNAMDVKVKVVFLVDERPFRAPAPWDGTRDLHIQGRHTVRTFLKMDHYLSQAGANFNEMKATCTAANRQKQLVMQVELSCSDGLGKPIKNPPLFWFFNFQKLVWEYYIEGIGQEPA
jgi:hypothetical protein